MKISELTIFFKNRKSESIKKSEQKVYKSFVEIFSDLNQKNLSEKQKQKINDKIEMLQLTSVSSEKTKKLKEKRNKLIKYLNENFSLIPRDHYTKLGMSTGIALGAPIGMTVGIFSGIFLAMIYGMLFGAVLGLVIGLILGKIKDNSAEKRNRVINARIS